MASDNIEGTATDSSGNPLQDAVIALFLTNKNANDGDINDVKYTRTNSNGNYVIKDHPDADGTSQEWHVAGFYQDGTGEFNALSKPSVEASVGLKIPSSLVSRTADNGNGNNTTNRGATIETSQEWPEFGLKISSKTGTVTRAAIYRTSDGTLMGESTGITKTSGDTVTIDLNNNLVSGEQYNVTVGDKGNSYTLGFNNSLTYPISSPDGNLEIVGGADGNTATTTNALWNIVELGNVGF